MRKKPSGCLNFLGELGMHGRSDYSEGGGDFFGEDELHYLSKVRSIDKMWG